MDDVEHKGCPGCDAAAHEKAVKDQENQQREEQSLTAGLTMAAVFACLVVLGLWAGVMTLLPHVI
ncbi:hypothetical protein [Streptomyces gilvosporeus]|uniref:Uncharacterized protein n=1 Tax=Streptomyces gilvosporeus TaxID=553510 RepID=A0A1V0TQ80_9ACTN|nr:hypothetical protein [Streptomyces gilvosporeus]ARF55091.1 hypothetical protein B1H19_13545 [Streptomyces gilvosporeus]